MKLIIIATCIALATLTGCAELTGGVGTQSQSGVVVQDAKLAQAYAALATARSTAATLLERDRINVADAEKVQANADVVRAVLDTARAALAAGRQASYEVQIGQALTLLAGLETYLKERQ